MKEQQQMTTEDIEIHTPAYAERTTPDAARHVTPPRLAPGARLRISFIDNEKPNTTRLLELVAERIGAHYAVETQRFTKGGAGLPAPAEVIERAARDADLAILATSD